MAGKCWISTARKIFGKDAVYHEGDERYAYITSCGELHIHCGKRRTKFRPSSVAWIGEAVVARAIGSITSLT
jgi:hypothetical protein